MMPLLATRRRLAAGMVSLVFFCLPSLASSPSWFEQGRPSARARQAVALMADAASQGLDPQELGVEAWSRLLARAEQQPLPAASVAAAEQSLTRDFQRYLSQIRRGRVDPAAVRQSYRAQRGERFDPQPLLEAALQHNDLAAAVAAAEPPQAQYRMLRQALAQYRQLAGADGWMRRLPALPKGARGQPKLEAGQDWGGLDLLAQRLRVLGDLGGEAVSTARYEGELVAAVRRFQLRHGLTPDGTLGVSTLAALEVAPATRVRQLELALERLRWTPAAGPGRLIEVNLPEFALRAYRVDDGTLQQELAMKVIIGKALKHQTPVFDQDLRFVEFSPYWNVPISIARAETIPRLRKDPRYFTDQGFEFVRRDGQVETGLEEGHLQSVLAGQMRIRQRPGTHNALGSVKFVFPNQDNIYLHHTPSIGLFERDRRDFSHGCIRVDRPRELAEFVLRGMPGWDRARIEAAMDKGESRTLRLNEAVPVVLAYGTSRVEGDRIYFYRDIYGLDQALDEALRHRPPVRPPDLP